MAVIYGGGGGNPLGLFGTLLGVGGTMMGAPWLSTLGAGMNAAGAAMNGNPSDLAGVLAGIANGDLNGMQNPGAGNIAMTEEDAALKQWREAMMQQQMRQGGWGY